MHHKEGMMEGEHEYIHKQATDFFKRLLFQTVAAFEVFVELPTTTQAQLMVDLQIDGTGARSQCDCMTLHGLGKICISISASECQGARMVQT